MPIMVAAQQHKRRKQFDRAHVFGAKRKKGITRMYGPVRRDGHRFPRSNKGTAPYLFRLTFLLSGANPYTIFRAFFLLLY